MAETEARGWKARLSIPVNYNSDSEDDLNNMDTDMTLNRLLRANRRNTVDAAYHEFSAPAPPPDSPERSKKRSTMKALRGRERDIKLDVGQAREHRSDSLPSPSCQEQVIPNIVESCSRFMSLTSRLKCSPESVECRRGAREETREEQEAPRSRIDFHNTFSMLIRMGNVDKNCRRAISVEEQVWQNERKDLIWLELRARLAGRTLQQQDEYLCAQRQVIPAIVQNINNYRFVNTTPCTYRSSRMSTTPASEGYHSSDETPPLHRNGTDPLDTITENLSRDIYNGDDERYQIFGCLGFECDACSGAVGKALKEVGTLLDSFYNAETLYPSSKAMAMKHPLIATQLFNNRLKAMCLWYNIAHILRLKVLGIRKLIKLLQWKAYSRQRSQQRPRPADAEPGSETESRHTPVVKFSAVRSGSGSNDSSNSESSGERAVPVVTLTLDEEQHTDSDGEGKRARRRESGTVDTTASNESGYTSEPECTSYLKVLASCDEAYNVIEVGPLSDITKLRLLGNCEVSPYRHYISDILKTQGLRKALMFIDKMRQNILKRAYMTFEKYNSSQQSQYPECEQAQIFDDTKDPKEEEDKSDRCRYENAKNAFELRRYGCWSEETLQMRLPSYRSTFLLLSTICMEVVHDYLSMRLETQPAKPSCLTVKQLMHELKEGLDIATEQRSAFVRNIDTALGGYDTSGETKDTFVRVVQVFDSTIERVLTQYLSYLTTMSEVEHMPRSMLEAEWGFAARLARRTRCAAMLAPHIFANIMSNQIEGVTIRFRDKFEQLQHHKVQLADGSDNDDESTKRHWVYSICRQAQSIYVSERELTIQTAQFSRLLATRLKKNACMQTAREKIFNSLMNARNCIVEYINLTTKKTEASSWDEDKAFTDVQVIAVRVREVLLQGYKLGFEFHKELHSFCHPRKPMHAPPETAEPVRRRPASLQPLTETHLRPKIGSSFMVNASYNLALNNLFHKEMHRFVNDALSERAKPAPLNARRPSSINVPAARGRPRLARSDSVGGEAYSAAVFQDCLQTTTSIEYGVPEMLFDGEEAFGRDSIARAADSAREPRAPADQVDGAREHVGGAREQAGGARDLEAAWAEAAARAVIEFAKNWMRFVTERCDRGRGLRPRWASQGLEFLMLACDPCNTKHLTEAEFEELKSCMDGCISHVVGSRSPGVMPPAQVATPPPQRGRHAPRSYSPHPLIQMQSKQKEVPTPPTPPTEPDPVVVFNMEEESLHSRRAASAARQIDESRDEQLAERRVVGRVVETAGVASQEPKLRQVTFRWQRGLKIGAGNFGKVYTVVNTESGQLLAMKEISIGVGDRRALQRAANELKVLEGILHPHLVRYYGCEVHREEMLIFMELCVEGSLEALLAESGALPEPAIRRYTKQLVSAVLELHNRQIAHRDIKTGNIFLTNERHCLKLGDFGCAVKIRANTTAAGELQGYVGTQAYMAPEVFMKSSGHGRAADIWSLGCVVTEMASGKRPFSEYDSNYQIMFVVGMGGRPEVAAALSEEGREFCRACLEHDPELRPGAADIVDHHFLKLKADEDQCDCEPGYLISK